MKYLVLIFSALFILSCKQEQEKPVPFIEKHVMQDIMYDFSLLSAIQGVSAYYTDSVEKINGESILNKYGIDSLVYVKNSEYYLSLEKGVYLKMLSDVKQRLEQQKVLVDTLVGQQSDHLIKPIHTSDSLLLQEVPSTDKVGVDSTQVFKGQTGLKLDSLSVP